MKEESTIQTPSATAKASVSSEDKGDSQEKSGDRSEEGRYDVIFCLPIGPYPKCKIQAIAVNLANDHLDGISTRKFKGADNALLNFAADTSRIANGAGNRVDEDSLFRLFERQRACERQVAALRRRATIPGPLRHFFHLFIAECNAFYARQEHVAGASFIHGLAQGVTPFVPGAIGEPDRILRIEEYLFDHPPEIYEKALQTIRMGNTKSWVSQFQAMKGIFSACPQTGLRHAKVLVESNNNYWVARQIKFWGDSEPQRGARRDTQAASGERMPPSNKTDNNEPARDPEPAPPGDESWPTPTPARNA